MTGKKDEGFTDEERTATKERANKNKEGRKRHAGEEARISALVKKAMS